MLRGWGRFHWYDLILVPMAVAIVYPDRVVEWLSETSGKIMGIRSLIAVEVVGLLGMFLAMEILMPNYPHLHWWYPVMMVGMLGFVRLGVWCARQLFGLDD